MAIYECQCITCTHLNDINDSHCNICGSQLPGTINTRRASIPIEAAALEKRFADAMEELTTKGLSFEANELIALVNSDGKALINTNIDFLWEWLIKGTSEYESYKRQIISNSRSKAKFENDVKRVLHDSILFGSENDIIYSALSVDENGLSSYGEATLILKIPPIQNRTSALETNSYIFIAEAQKNGWSFDKPLPAGYMSTWFTKDKLCVSKLGKKLKKGLKKDEISRLILTSHGDRSTDDFIELYIYGTLIHSTLEKIKIPASAKTSADLRKKLKLTELEKKFTIEYHA